MAASEKTAVLGLSRWKGTDKPRRADFVADNDALEEKVGGHLNDADLHLNADRAARLDTPWEARSYTGNGAAQRAVLFGFTPRFAAVFAVGKGLCAPEGDCIKQYAAFAQPGQSTEGIALNAIQVIVRQAASVPESGGVMAALNETGVTYILLAFR